MVSPWLVALPAVHSSCASAYTTAAEMLARWCARNELGDVRAVPYWVESSVVVRLRTAGSRVMVCFR